MVTLRRTRCAAKRSNRSRPQTRDRASMSIARSDTGSAMTLGDALRDDRED